MILAGLCQFYFLLFYQEGARRKEESRRNRRQRKGWTGSRWSRFSKRNFNLKALKLLKKVAQLRLFKESVGVTSGQLLDPVSSRPSVQGWREAEGGEGAGGSEGKEGHLWVSERKVLEGWPKKAWRCDKRAQWSLSQSFGQTSCSCCYQLARRYKLLLPDSSQCQTYTVTLKGHIQRYISKCRRHFNFGLISSSLWWSNDTLSLNLISEHLTFDI